jgi:hypothetical protein
MSKHKNKKYSQSQDNTQTKNKSNDSSQQKVALPTSTVIKLDSRAFSKQAYQALQEMVTKEDDPYFLTKDYHKRASGLVQGLPSYISTWGLHRLSGDASNFFAKTKEDTKYKGKVYRKFLVNLQALTQIDFEIENEGSLISLPLREYTGLNRLAIKLAKEWSFWAASVLGEAEL